MKLILIRHGYTKENFDKELWYLDYITEAEKCDMIILHMKALTNEIVLKEFDEII